MQETRVQSLSRKIPWRRKWQPTPVLLPGKSHGHRSLEGCSPWVAKSRTRLSDLTWLHFTLKARWHWQQNQGFTRMEASVKTYSDSMCRHRALLPHREGHKDTEPPTPQDPSNTLWRVVGRGGNRKKPTLTPNRLFWKRSDLDAAKWHV